MSQRTAPFSAEHLLEQGGVVEVGAERLDLVALEVGDHRRAEQEPRPLGSMTTSSSITNGPENVAVTGNSAKPLFPKTPRESIWMSTSENAELAQSEVLGEIGEPNGQHVRGPQGHVVGEHVPSCGDGGVVGPYAGLDGANQRGATGLLSHERSSCWIGDG